MRALRVIHKPRGQLKGWKEGLNIQINIPLHKPYIVVIVSTKWEGVQKSRKFMHVVCEWPLSHLAMTLNS